MANLYIEDVTNCDICQKEFEVVLTMDDDGNDQEEVIIPVDETKLGHFCSNRCRSKAWFYGLPEGQRKAVLAITQAMNAILDVQTKDVVAAFDEVTSNYFGGFIEDIEEIMADLGDDDTPAWMEEKGRAA